MSNFAITISFRLDETDTNYTTIILDTIDNESINLSSTVSTHPMVNKQIVADHMFDDPSSITISGTFSLQGSKGIVINQQGAKLANIQDLFETIKSKGILCNIVKIHIINNSNGTYKESQFKERKNMVLNSIRWTQKINSLDFSFGFTEAILAEITTEPLKDIKDEYLPSITDVNTLSFTDTLINWEQINSLISKIELDEGLVTKDFSEYMASKSESELNALLITGGVIGITATILLANPVGIIIGAGAMIIIAIFGWITSNNRQKNFRIQQFELSKDDEKNRKEVERYINYRGEIHKQFLELNNAIKVYGFSSDDNQECMTTIDNNYYIFKIIKNTSDNSYSLDIYDVDNVIKRSLGDISSAPNDISQCTSKNYLFRTPEYGTYVYLMCPNNDKTKLTNYYIMTSTINMEKYCQTLEDIIINAITY